MPVVAFYHSDLSMFFHRPDGPPAELAAAVYTHKLYPHFDTVFVPNRYTVQKVTGLGTQRIEL